jgi:conjugal transfer pilus assembly protein TraW
MLTKIVRFYFDQNGNLTRKFEIKSVPAIVEQEGKMLKISEVVI